MPSDRNHETVSSSDAPLYQGVTFHEGRLAHHCRRRTGRSRRKGNYGNRRRDVKQMSNNRDSEFYRSRFLGGISRGLFVEGAIVLEA